VANAGDDGTCAESLIRVVTKSALSVPPRSYVKTTLRVCSPATDCVAEIVVAPEGSIQPWLEYDRT
jgi:hypothetical protein